MPILPPHNGVDLWNLMQQLDARLYALEAVTATVPALLSSGSSVSLSVQTAPPAGTNKSHITKKAVRESSSLRNLTRYGGAA